MTHSMTMLQDVVTRGSKLVFLYSWPGQHVLVSACGDMIVRPSWVEASIQRLPGGAAFTSCLITLHAPHLQTSYKAVLP